MLLDTVHLIRNVLFSCEYTAYHGDNDCVKSVRIWSFSGPYFPTFGLNTERRGTQYSPYSVRMRENMDQKNSGYGHFPRSEYVCLSHLHEYIKPF